MFNAGYNSPRRERGRQLRHRLRRRHERHEQVQLRRFNADGDDQHATLTSCTDDRHLQGQREADAVGLVGLPDRARPELERVLAHLPEELPDGGGAVCPSGSASTSTTCTAAARTAATIRKVNNAGEITVDDNGDNSVETNDFDVTNGRNCITIVAGGDHDGGDLRRRRRSRSTTRRRCRGIPGRRRRHDHVQGVRAVRGGHSRTADCTGARSSRSTVPVNGPGSYGSGNFTPTQAGLYFWTADYSGTALMLGASSPCGAANETSTSAKCSRR